MQRAVLSLADVGIGRATDQAESLGLDPELIAFVLQELQNDGRINAYGDLTRAGLELLQADKDQPVKAMRLYVFQDPFGASDGSQDILWPRAVKRLEFAAMTSDDGLASGRGTTSWPRLDQSTPSADRTTAVHFLDPSSAQLPKPRRETIARALEEWLRTMPDAECRPTFAGKPQECVRLVEPEPEHMWILTQLYVPDEELLDGRWRAADPFMPGDLPWLRSRLHSLRGVPNAVRGNRLNRTVGMLVDQEESAEGDEKAEYSALARFGAELARHDVIREHLIDLIAADSALSTQGKPDGVYRRARKEAARNVGILLEHTCYRLGQGSMFPIRGEVERVRELLHTGIQKHGWGECPSAWRYSDKVLDKLKYGDDLRDMMARTCAAALQHDAHPLHRWLAAPRDISRFDDLRKWRNDNSHDLSAQLKATHLSDSNELASQRIGDALDFIECVLPFLPTEP